MPAILPGNDTHVDTPKNYPKKEGTIIDHTTDDANYFIGIVSTPAVDSGENRTVAVFGVNHLPPFGLTIYPLKATDEVDTTAT